MGSQVVEIVDELVELTMKTRCESFRLHDVDGEPTKIARAVCDADPRAENERRALGGTALVNLNEAIEFAGGSSMARQLSVFYRLPTEGYTRGGKF
jgi:hypothetical protein